MGYKQDGLVLSSEWEVDLDVAGKWATSSTARAFLQPLRETGWLERATHYWVDDDDPALIPPEKELDRLASRWRKQTAALYAGDAGDPTWMFWLSMRRTGVAATVSFAREHVTGSLCDELADLVAAWARALASEAPRAAISAITPWGAGYDRPVPHRESEWPLGAISYLLGRGWHQADPDRASVLRAIEAAPTGPGIERTAAGDLLRLTFACDVSDPTSVAAARARGERWFSPLVTTRLAPGWNERGDRLVVVVDRDDLEPFTFHDTFNGIGYKAMVVDPDTGDVDEPMWSKLAAITETKEAHDGTPIKEVRLIVPTRQDAVRLGARARADGIDLVVYPEGDSLWWVDNAKKAVSR
jgi:hypothetical protein